VQVVIPAGALDADTTIGIARNTAGAPARLADGQPAGPIYEFTPHNLIFNKPVLFRFPVPAGTTTATPLIHSFNEGWEAWEAVVANGFAEWERNTFSWSTLNVPCASTNSNDPHPCAQTSGHSFVTATPSDAITQLTGAPGFRVGSFNGLVINQGEYYSVDTAALTTLHVTLFYRGAPDCTNGRARIKKIIQGTGGAGGQAQLVDPPGEVGAPFNINANEGSVTFDVPWDQNSTARTVYSVQFSCDRPDYNPGGGYTTGGYDWITVIPSTPAVPGFSYGGTITGLTASGLELQNGAREVLSVPANSTAFTFLTRLASGAPYSVRVKTQPAGQHCTVQNGSSVVNVGIISDVSNIAVTCTGLTIGGTVSGLNGTGLVLQNNGGNDLAITANGAFTFTAPVAVGANYNVTVLTQPTGGQTCTVTNGSGTNVTTNVTTVAVTCVASGPVPLAATSIATGFWSSLVAATDGTVWAWGQFVDPVTGGFKASSPFATTPVQVQGLSGVKAVAVSSEAAAFYALHTDGTVSAWGFNSSGQLGDRTTTTRTTPVKVLNGVNTPIDEVCSISAGVNFLVMLRDESCSPGVSGVVSGPWIVGLLSGSIGGTSGGTVATAVPGLPSGVAVNQMSTCSAANCGGKVFFRLANGNSLVWGNNTSNVLGAGTSTPFAGGTGGPVDASFFWSGKSSVRLGRTFSVASDGAGSLLAVGGDLNGELGNGVAGSSSTLTPVSVLTNVSAFSAGQVNAAAITNSELWVWGTMGNIVYSLTTPTRLGTGTGFTQVSVGDAHGLAIGPGGEVYSWGEPTFGALGRSGSGGTPAIVSKP
jgi:alpha-tubulin suppressor-like RCC1 family protein